LVGVAPNVTQSKVITPSSGTLILVGGTATISNPNWIPIVPSQTPSWGTITTTQTPNWLRVAA